jgi:regulator of replication initiation timing
MNSEIIRDLEENIERAMQVIATLRDQKSILEKENVSLRGQVESLRKQLEEQKKAISTRAKASRQLDFDSREVKVRLEKLVSKLAALEDSWS